MKKNYIRRFYSIKISSMFLMWAVVAFGSAISVYRLFQAMVFGVPSIVPGSQERFLMTQGGLALITFFSLVSLFLISLTVKGEQNR